MKDNLLYPVMIWSRLAIIKDFVDERSAGMGNQKYGKILNV